MFALYLFPLVSALKLQREQIPETNLDTILSANMGLSLPTAPSDAVLSTYRHIIETCIPDYDTVYIGIYPSEVDTTVKIKHIQTSVEGHIEHMDNSGTAVGLMVAASEGIQPLGSDLGGPESMLYDPKLNAILDKMPSRRDYVYQGGKKHRFTAMNHGEVANLTLVMLDRYIRLPSGLTPEVKQITDQFISLAETVPTQGDFAILYRAEDQTLAFREIYKDTPSVKEFRERTQTIWNALTTDHGTLLRQEVAGPSQELQALKDWWSDHEGAAQFFPLYDGFQRVQVQN